MTQKVVARFIIEIAGKPKENVDKALNLVEKRLKENKDFKVLDSEVVESELDEDSKLYSGFLDVQIKFKETRDILGFIMDYTPTSVEVEEPDKLSFQAADVTTILNDMSRHILRTANEIRKLRAHIHMTQKLSKQSKK